MTGKQHYWLLAFATLWLAPLPARADTATKLTETNLPQIALHFDAKTHDLEFAVRNAGTSALSVDDPFTRRPPAALMVRFLSKDGHIMSENSYFPDGYINSHILDADMGDHAPLPMKLLAPGQKLVEHITLQEIVAGLERGMSTQIRNGGDYCVQFKAKVYTSPDLETFVEEKSEVTCLKDFEGFRRTGNSNTSGITIGDPTTP